MSESTKIITVTSVELTVAKLESKLADSNQHIVELENRLRALWDKYENDLEHYRKRINRLEEAGNSLVGCLEGWGVGSGPIKIWFEAKEAKP